MDDWLLVRPRMAPLLRRQSATKQDTSLPPMLMEPKPQVITLAFSRAALPRKKNSTPRYARNQVNTKSEPFSTAGKGRAADDERHLWPAWFSLIRECRPAVLDMAKAWVHAAAELRDVSDHLETSLPRPTRPKKSNGQNGRQLAE
jgi:hypothetical protein